MKTFPMLLFLVIANASFSIELTQNLKINLLEKNVYIHTSSKFVDGYGLVDSNGLVVLDGRDAYIVDTPWSDGGLEH